MPVPNTNGVLVRHVAANGLDVEVATVGNGQPILLLHGWPHTWRLWEPVMRRLAATHRVIAPDLRGIGGTTKADGGYDVATLADDAVALLDALDLPHVAVAAIDAGVQPAAMLALRAPHRVERLILMEGLLGALPGAEAFLANGAPWWFGFHTTPGLAETVLVGHEAEYIDWFLTSGTLDGRGIDPATRDAFVQAYTGKKALRCGFEHYRALRANNDLLTAALAKTTFSMPTLAIEGGMVGAAISGQLRRVSTSFEHQAVAQCKHLIPLEQPEALAEIIMNFVV